MPTAHSGRFRAAPDEPIASRRWFKRSQRVLGRVWPTAYLFLGPTLLLLGLIKAYPFLQAVWFSFHRVIGFRIIDFAGLDNYIALWGDDRFTRAVGTPLPFPISAGAFKLRLGLAPA